MASETWLRLGQPVLLSAITLGMGTTVTLLLGLSAKLDIIQSLSEGNQRDVIALRREFDAHLGQPHVEAATSLADLRARLEALRHGQVELREKLREIEREVRAQQAPRL